MKNTGFTLIELLVVVSIISLLSSMMLASVNKARTKATNAVIVAEIIQYRNALELYYAHNATYPVLEDSAWHCLGIGYTNNVCGFSNLPPLTNSPMLNAKLGTLINLPTVSQTPIVVDGPSNITITGAFYACWPDANNRCSNAGVEWAVSGNGAPCGIGGATSQIYGNSTVCKLNLIGQVGAILP